MMKTPLLLASAVLAAALAAPASAQVIDFESTPVGVLAEGTTIGGITFTSATGSYLYVGSFAEGDGRSLGVWDDGNGNYLRGAIAGGSNFLSLDFGNDDPGYTTLTDLATLRVFSGATLVDTVTMALNRDDLMNQTISYSGSFFDNFEFAYTNAAGAPFTGGNGFNTGLIEIVDNIRFGAAVPEPATWLMLFLGFGFIGFSMRHRKTEQRLAVTYA
jgi:hypothetical protein